MQPADQTTAEAVTPLAIAQAAVLCSEIAAVAQRLDRQFYWADNFADLDVAAGEGEQVDIQMEALRAAIARLGWMADLATVKLTGQSMAGGDPTVWMLPPIYPQEPGVDTANPYAEPASDVVPATVRKGARHAAG